MRTKTLMIIGVAAGVLCGCPLVRDTDEFYQSSRSRDIRPGEQVLFYGEAFQDYYVVVTDERVLFNHWMGVGSVELVEVKRFYKARHGNIDVELYHGGIVTVHIQWGLAGKVGNHMQSQLDYIKQLRDELGISVPEATTRQELEELNKPLLAELRARRKRLEHHVGEKEISQWCRSSDGKLYTRMITSECPSGWTKAEATSVPALTCEHPVTGRLFSVDASECPDNWTTIIEGR